MGQIRKIICDVYNCNVSYEEEMSNEGFPGWGHVEGIFNPITKVTKAYLCPKHLIEIKKILNGKE